MQQTAQTITMQNRGNFFFLLNADLLQWSAIVLDFSFPEDKITYSCMTGRAAKILAPHWLNTPVLHSVGFLNFKFFGVRLFRPGCLYHKYMEIKCCS